MGSLGAGLPRCRLTMPVDTKLLQGSLPPRDGQKGAGRCHEGLTGHQHAAHLIAGGLAVLESLSRIAKVLAGLVSCLSPGCLAFGEKMLPHQLAGGKLLEGGLRAQGSLNLATDERILRWRPLRSLSPSLTIKRTRHMARRRDCISDSKSGLEWAGRLPVPLPLLLGCVPLRVLLPLLLQLSLLSLLLPLLP